MSQALTLSVVVVALALAMGTGLFLAQRGTGASLEPDSWIISEMRPVPSAPRTAAALQLSVFDRAQQEGDRLPQALQHQFGMFVAASSSNVARPEADPFGELLLNSSRRLISSPVEIFAVPTTKGGVCYVSRRLGPVWVGGLTEGVSWTAQFRRSEKGIGGTLHVHGLVSDEIEDVIVILNEVEEPAALGSNVFFLERKGIKVRPDDLKGLRLRLTNGSVRLVEMTAG